MCVFFLEYTKNQNDSDLCNPTTTIARPRVIPYVYFHDVGDVFFRHTTTDWSRSEVKRWWRYYNNSVHNTAFKQDNMLLHDSWICILSPSTIGSLSTIFCMQMFDLCSFFININFSLQDAYGYLIRDITSVYTHAQTLAQQ